MSGGTVILGAGPTGLGAAYRLVERGEKDFEIFERSGQVGGLATSFVDPKGWTWDVSGHIIFSGYKYFNDFLGKVLGKDGIRWIDRESWIKFEDKYVRYPFQNHLSSLPEQAMLECLIGLVESQTIEKDRAFTNFEEWVLAKFGSGVAKHFMNPYNFKVWATPLEKMGYYWIAERVSVVDWRKAIETTVVPKSTDWGPEREVRLSAPRRNAGALEGRPAVPRRPRAVPQARRLGRRREARDRVLGRIDAGVRPAPDDHADRRVRRPADPRAGGRSEGGADAPLQPALLGRRGLEASVAVGQELDLLPEPEDAVLPDDLPLELLARDRARAATRRRYFSVLTETSYSKFKPLPKGDFGKAVVDGLVAEGILQPSDLPLIETIFLIHAGHSYPIPSTDRNPALETIHAYLEPRGIFSRGRFGSWKYEIGNQDHSLMQGVELVDRWLDGSEEKVFRS